MNATPNDNKAVVEKLAASLKEMLEVYWGDGDGQLPEPTCIQNARAALELAGAK